MKMPNKPARKPVPPPPKGAVIVPTLAKAEELLPINQQESLVAWFNLYMGRQALAGSATVLEEQLCLPSRPVLSGAFEKWPLFRTESLSPVSAGARFHAPAGRIPASEAIFWAGCGFVILLR